MNILNTSNKKISVAMATYNGEKYIKEQLDSIISQLSINDEIIISDDGSTDNTVEIIKKYNNSIIKIVEGPHDGIIKNFENALKYCQGDIIFLSDQDDVWENNKVEEIMNCFKDTNAILIVHDAKIVDEKLNIINNSFFDFRKVKNGLVNNLLKNSFIGCCMAFKKELLNSILPIPKKFPMHDQWIGMIALKNKNKVIFLQKKLIKYRRHFSNASNFKKNTLLKMLKNRIIILKCLYSKERS